MYRNIPQSIPSSCLTYLLVCLGFFHNIVKKARESLVSDIPVGDGKIANLFYRFYRFFIGLTCAYFISGSIQYISTVLLCSLLLYVHCLNASSSFALCHF